MDAVRAKWTDERLDDLSGKVDDLGRKIDTRFDAVERRLGGIDDRIDRLLLGMTAVFLTGFLALAGLILGQG
jgi:hypothetical protein